MASRAASRGRSRAVASALIVGGLTTAMVSCGSRTGLFGPDTSFFYGTADAGDDATVQCVPGQFTFELALTQLMFVVDRSGSMKFALDGAQNVPRPEWRWTILKDALQQTITSFDGEIAMGATFFPEEMTERESHDAELACRTETGAGIAPARGNAAAILDVFDATEPIGGTPTAEALRLAAQFLTQRRSVASTIVLATDGAPNCNGDLDGFTCICTGRKPSDCTTTSGGDYSCLDDGRAVKTIRTIAEEQKVPVYVIGIGSADSPAFLQVLDEMAVAGGRPRPTTPRHYNAQSEEDLTAALTTIRDTVAKCTYLTPSAPNDPEKIRVQIDGVGVRRDTSKQNGWDWVDRELGELAFFGDACTRARGASGVPAVISGVVSCDE